MPNDYQIQCIHYESPQHHTQTKHTVPLFTSLSLSLNDCLIIYLRFVLLFVMLLALLTFAFDDVDRLRLNWCLALFPVSSHFCYALHMPSVANSPQKFSLGHFNLALRFLASFRRWIASSSPSFLDFWPIGNWKETKQELDTVAANHRNIFQSLWIQPTNCNRFCRCENAKSDSVLMNHLKVSERQANQHLCCKWAWW